MNKMNKTLIIFFLTVYIIGSLYTPNLVKGEGSVIPEIDGDGPLVNGNVSDIEWLDAVQFQTTVAGENATVLVVANSSFLFIGFNYTTTQSFVPVNNTLPVYNSTTVGNYSLSYNNATHDWLAIQFDNNLDQAAQGSTISPDDAIVIDQYNSSSYDAYMNGNTTVPFFSDLNNNGKNDSFAQRLNYTIDDTTYVQYEFQKSLNSQDVNGSDIDLEQQRILQFKFVYWQNESANATITTSQTTQWFTLRINETGTGLTTKPASETKVKITTTVTDLPNFQAMQTVLSFYGYSVDINTNGTFTTDNEAVQILMITKGTTLLSSYINDLTDYIKLGGKLIFFLSNEASDVSTNIAEKFGFEYLPNNILVPSETPGISSEVFTPAPKTNLPFTQGSSLVTDNIPSKLSFASGAFNVSKMNNYTSQPYVLSQEYFMYDLFTLPDDAVYDSNGNGDIDTKESAKGVSAGVAMDLQKGGRVTLIPSTSMFENDQFLKEDNIDYLLRLIPWNAKTANSVSVESIKIDQNKINPGDVVNVKVSVVDEFGNAFDNSVTVNVEIGIIIAGNTVISKKLDGTGSNYSSDLEINEAGFMVVKALVFLEGYGYSESDSISVLSEREVRSFNDLSNLSIIMIIVFILSIIAVVIVLQKTR